MNHIEANHFFAEVVANPQSDDPRLIYADWLEEHGDQRGEFIRVQCELDKSNDLQKEFYELGVRSTQLTAEHGEKWASELEQDLRKSEFKRGFIDKITIRALALVKGADSLFASTPINELRIVYLKNQGKKVAELPQLSQVRGLDLSNLTIPTDDLLAVIKSPNLSNLESLSLCNYSWYDSTVGKALTSFASRDKLQSLTINAGRDHSIFTDVCEGPGFPNLTDLTLWSEENINENLDSLDKLNVPKLKSLRVCSRLNVKDCETLSKLSLGRLESLNLKNTKIPARGLAIISDSGAFKTIKHLDLSYCDIGIRSFEHLFDLDNLQHCESLDLSHSSLATEKTLRKIIGLIANHPLPNVKRLILGSFDDLGLEPLFHPNSFPKLESLHLDSVVINDEVANKILAHPIRERLKRLTFSGARFAENSAEILRESVFPNLFSLRFLDSFCHLENTQFSELSSDSVLKLLSSKAFPEVRELVLDSIGGANSLERIGAEGILPELRRFVCRNYFNVGPIREFLKAKRFEKLGELDFRNAVKPSKKLISEFAPDIVIK